MKQKQEQAAEKKDTLQIAKIDRFVNRSEVRALLGGRVATIPGSK